jgi:carbamoyl-phosphate synthase large subunit
MPSVPTCWRITAVDTANALVDCLRSDHSLENIPLVDIATLYHRK